MCSSVVLVVKVAEVGWWRKGLRGRSEDGVKVWTTESGIVSSWRKRRYGTRWFIVVVVMVVVEYVGMVLLI